MIHSLGFTAATRCVSLWLFCTASLFAGGDSYEKTDAQLASERKPSYEGIDSGAFPGIPVPVAADKVATMAALLDLEMVKVKAPKGGRDEYADLQDTLPHEYDYSVEKNPIVIAILLTSQKPEKGRCKKITGWEQFDRLLTSFEESWREKPHIKVMFFKNGAYSISARTWEASPNTTAWVPFKSAHTSLPYSEKTKKTADEVAGGLRKIVRQLIPAH